MSIHNGFGLPVAVCELFESKSPAGIQATKQMIVGLIQKREVKPSFLDLRNGLLLAMRANAELTEAISSDVFNTLSREIVVDAVLEGFDSIPKIGRELVTVIRTPKKKDGRLARSTWLSSAEEVQELEEYPQVQLGDKYVTYSNKKYGFQIVLSIEALEEDQTGTVLDNARSIGMKLANMIEERILKTIQDLANHKAYYPAGAETALYAGGAAESINQTPAMNQQVNALADWTDIDNAIQLLGSKLGEDGKPIGPPTNISMLTPWALRGTAAYIKENTKDTRTQRNADAPRLLDLPNGVRSSAWLDQTSTTTWYLGDFADQFAMTERWPLRTAEIAGKGQASMLVRDIDRLWLASVFFDVIARCFRRVIKNTAA